MVQQPKLLLLNHRQAIYMNKQKGFSFIELVVFITIVGIMSSGLIQLFNNSLAVYKNNSSIMASSLARSRMEIIIYNRQGNYAALTDPCANSTTGICSTLNTFAINNNLSVSSTITESAPNKTIVVQTTDTSTNNGYLLQTLVSNYD